MKTDHERMRELTVATLEWYAAGGFPATEEERERAKMTAAACAGWLKGERLPISTSRWGQSAPRGRECTFSIKEWPQAVKDQLRVDFPVKFAGKTVGHVLEILGDRILCRVDDDGVWNAIAQGSFDSWCFTGLPFAEEKP